jgi:hypothetical protein
MKFVASTRLRLFGALLLAVTLVVAAALTATSRAGSVRASVDVQITPHVLTAGQRGLITIKFLNSGPSTVNHVFATVNAGTGSLPLPAGAFTGFTLPTGCSVVGTTSTVLTCDLGQVPPGLVRRVISFTAPAAVAPFSVHVSASFDEGKNTGLTDTVTGDDLFPFSIASSTDTTKKGQCTALGSTLTASDTDQQTVLTYLALPSTLLPCTPASAGVATGGANNVPHFGKVSFVDFLDGAGLATVRIFFLSPPKGVTKKNLALYELPNFPIDLTATTTTDGSTAVPPCVTGSDGNLQIPSGSPFVSCVVSVDTLSGGGLVATLLARGGNDSGWGGAG